MTKNTKILTGVIAILILFFGGFATGYYNLAARSEDQPPDYKSLLKDAAGYIGSLEEQQRLQQRMETADSRKRQSSSVSQTGAPEVHSTIKDLLAKTQFLESENLDLREAMGEMPSLRENAGLAEDLKTRNQKLAAEVQAATEAKLDLEKQNAGLRSEAEKQAQLASENQKVERQFNDARQYATGLEKEVSELRATLKQQQDMTARSQEVEARMQTCLGTTTELEKKIAALDSAAEQSKVLAAENLQLENRVQTFTREIQEMRARFNEIQTLVSGNMQSGS